MWSCVIGIAFILSTFYWINLARVLKYVIDRTEISSLLYYYIHQLISNYLPCFWQSMLISVNNKTFFILHAIFFFTFESIYLKYIKYLQYGTKSEHRISNNMWPHVFISEVRSYFPCFFVFLLGLYILIIVCGNCTLIYNMGRCWNPL